MVKKSIEIRNQANDARNIINHAKNDFGKIFFKLMNNCVFEKDIENCKKSQRY